MMIMRQLGVLSAFVLLTLAVLTAARPKANPDQKCKSGPMDLVFLIDSSRSVRSHEFETMRKFMIDIIKTLDIGPEATRVGVVQYSSQVRSEFSLKTHGKLESMVKSINEIIPLAQGTMTGLAIRYIMNEAFTAEQGDRPKAPNVAVIVTDGRPQDRVAEVAAEAREKGIEIFAVGVARADMTSLRALASPPFEDHVYLVESFDLIHQFGLQFQDKLCGLDLCVESDHGCEHICESSPGSYSCLCLPGYTLNDDGKTCTAIDLCTERKHNCEQICISSPGSFTCNCNKGYQLNEDKRTCSMIEYCSFGNHSCDHNCVNVLGGFFCTCKEGYRLLGDGKTCQAIDMCAEGKHDCEQICANMGPGTFTCDCNDGYALNEDEKSCTPIDLCAEGKHDCEQVCVSAPGVFTCDCNKGFKLNRDKKTCTNMQMCNTVAHGCEHQCVSTPGSFYCTCPQGQLLQEDGKSCSCKSANIDLVLLIDGSKSVRPQNFELVKKFVNQVVDSLDVSVHGTRVGLVQYSSRVRTEFPLNMYHTAEEIKAAVMKVDYMEKGTMTGLALKQMLENSFSEAEGARPASRNIPRVGLVFTDGRSQDDISEYAKKAKEAGITMYAVGVGKAVEDELREIASEPMEKHFYYTTDFNAISTIAENLKLNVCPAESQGEIEVKDPCACENLVEFQQATMSSLQQFTQKLAGMAARLEQLENQLLSRK
ncbi:matrilin-4 isoform X1 [Cololabis saira]|uniref:matrilin-4 isoform X1 n=1 Tax=Cololabis saira TaxID=129043 RepID=UPI002AD4E070|nr:matrilin-4 isoform X1 [Cololabis saira]XP_061583026.1 matrilin-4 isoform X1 [Cololabis saira]